MARACDAVIIVDVLSFTTCVEIAISRQCTVFPTALRGREAAALAQSHNATLAGPRSRTALSLSPASLLHLKPGASLVLPSLNGSSLSALAPGGRTLAACLRNRAAAGRAAQAMGRTIGIIPAGERWPDGSLRAAWEDLIGAGALIELLPGTRSPEAAAAEAAWRNAAGDLPDRLRASASGRELVEMGFATDVDLAAQIDISSAVPLLIDGRYTAKSRQLA